MAAVRQYGTAPEQIVRKAVRELGMSYRCGVRSLPGSPDIANARRRFAVFVHGCFWHRHPGCKKATMPKSNVAFWRKKFRDNIRRDARNIAALEKMGYQVAIVWECDAVNVEKAKDFLSFLLP
jgi:DNA mismatch endonuclease Vsr